MDRSLWRRRWPKAFKTGTHIAREREPRSDQTRYQTRNCTILRACPTRVFQAKNQRKGIPRTIVTTILVLEWDKRCHSIKPSSHLRVPLLLRPDNTSQKSAYSEPHLPLLCEGPCVTDALPGAGAAVSSASIPRGSARERCRIKVAGVSGADTPDLETGHGR